MNFSAADAVASCLVILGWFGPLHAQANKKLPATIAPALDGDRLLLWGGFDRDDRPVLEHTLLTRYGDGVRTPAGLFAKRYEIEGRLAVIGEDGRTHVGTWGVTCRRWFAVPGGGGELGYGWEGEIPYIQDAREYRLFYLGRDIGGERFPDPPTGAWSKGSLKCIESMIPIEPSDDSYLPSDVVSWPPSPVHQYFWDLEVSHGTAPHGTWMKVLDGPGTRRGIVVQRGDVQVAWPLLNWNAGRQDTSKSTRFDWWRPESNTSRTFPILLDRDPELPQQIRVLLRRSFGLTVFEDLLALEAKKMPPGHDAHQHSTKPPASR